MAQKYMGPERRTHMKLRLALFAKPPVQRARAVFMVRRLVPDLFQDAVGRKLERKAIKTAQKYRYNGLERRTHENLRVVLLAQPPIKMAVAIFMARLLGPDRFQNIVGRKLESKLEKRIWKMENEI